MPDDAVIVIRGGPVTVEKIVGHSLRQRELFSFRGEPMAAIRPTSRSRLDSGSAGGYELLATFQRPHYSIVLPEATEDVARILLARFGSTLDNPYRQRRR